MHVRTLVMCAAVLSAACAARAQAPEAAGPFPAGRPGFTELTPVVPAGVVEVNGGVTYVTTNDHGAAGHSVFGGNPLARVGLGHGLELRAGGDGFRDSWVAGGGPANSARGMSDVSLSAKLHLAGESRLFPELAVVSGVSLPSGSAPFSSSGYDPAAKLAWSKNLWQGFSATGNFSVASITDAAGRFAQTAISGLVGHSLPGGLIGFAEAYRVSPVARAAGDAWTVDGGVLHSLGRSAQVDVSVGRSVSGVPSSWFVAAGVAVRHPLGWLRR